MRGKRRKKYFLWLIICTFVVLFGCGCSDNHREEGGAQIMNRLYNHTERMKITTSVVNDETGKILTKKSDIQKILEPCLGFEMHCDSETEGLPANFYTPSFIMGQVSMTCYLDGDDTTYGVSVTKSGMVYLSVVQESGETTVYYTKEGALEYASLWNIIVEITGNEES